MVRSYQECHEILRSHRFAGAAGRPEGRTFLGDSVLLVDGDEHRDRRLMYMPLVRPERLAAFETEVIRPMLAAGFATHLGTAGRDGWARGDLVALARDVCMRMAAALIGFDNYAEPQAARRLFELVGPLGAGAAVEWSERDHDEVIREGLEAKRAYVAEYFAPSWRRRTARAGSGDGPTDLLAILAANLQPHWDADLPVRESILFLAGSTGNPVGQIVYAFDDLWRWVGDHPADRDRLTEETFVRHAIDETLRLHIAGSPVLVRQAKEDVVLTETGRSFAEGELVGLDMAVANRDPEVFGDDADRFDPGRWERLPPRVAEYGLAFGGGPHLCLGRPLMLGRSMRSVDIDGLEYLTLRALFDAGVEPDPGAEARLTTGGQLQYAEYPVRMAVR